MAVVKQLEDMIHAAVELYITYLCPVHSHGYVYLIPCTAWPLFLTGQAG